MRIADAGWRFVGKGAAVFAAGFLAASVGARWGAMWLVALGWLAAALGGGFALFSCYFFRDPERRLPEDLSKLYSPGDGRVMSVAREGPGDIVTLRIFLSPLNVHIQRAPCAGLVDHVQHHSGTFLAAMKEGAKANERTVMRLKPERGGEPLVVEQVAGFLARRIECWPKVGDRLKAGERYGIIHFGSQAAVHFPPSARCTVKPGDLVAAGVTPIGEWIA